MGVRWLSESRASVVVLNSIVALCISTISLALRLASRKIAKAGFWYDDYAIIVASSLGLVLPILLLIGMFTSSPIHLRIPVSKGNNMGQASSAVLGSTNRMPPLMQILDGIRYCISWRTSMLQVSLSLRCRCYSSTGVYFLAGRFGKRFTPWGLQSCSGGWLVNLYPSSNATLSTTFGIGQVRALASMLGNA